MNSLCVALFGILRLVMSYFNKILNSGIHVSASYDISAIVINHIHKCAISKTDKLDPAYYNHRISQDAGIVVDYAITLLVGIITTGSEVLLILITIFTLSPSILVISVFLIGLYFIVYRIMKKPLYERGKITKENQAVYFSKMYEQINYTKFVKAHSVKGFFLERLQQAFLKFRCAYMNNQKLTILFKSFDDVIVILSQMSLFIIGGNDIFSNKMTIGSFTIISSYFTRLFNAAGFFFAIGGLYQNTLVSYNRLLEILSWKDEEIGNDKPEEVFCISLRSVSFSYNEDHLLKDFSFEFSRGNIYAISGKNGSGKSSLLQLILGLYRDRYSGSININGIPIEDIDMVELRKEKFGYIEQEPVLFADTISRNVLLKQDVPFKYSMNSNGLHILDFVHRLPNTWDSTIAPKRNNLSGGERQRIALARVLNKDCDVMVLDEPTSALDNNIIDALISHLTIVSKQKIIIIVTHDDRIINICDKVITL